MASGRKRTGGFLWDRRRSVGSNLQFLLLGVPLIAIAMVPIVPYVYVRDALRRLRYIPLDGSEEQLYKAALRRAPWRCRWLGHSLSVADVDAALGTWRQWRILRRQIQPGDKLRPFTINPYSFSMRQGIVAVRGGQAVGIVVVEVS